MVVVGDIWEMQLNQSYLARNIQNHHCFKVVDPGYDWVQQVFDIWNAVAKGYYCLLRSEFWQLSDITFREIVPGTGGEIEIDTPVTNGVGTYDGWAPAQAARINWRTARQGKSYKGCTMMGGYTQFDVAYGVLGPNLVTALTTYADTMLAQFGPGGTYEGLAQFGVLSRWHDGAPVVPPTIEQITAYTVEFDVRQQRRRRLDY